ncbi:hypothetical protein NECID01_1779 [Nematocida sp. AWRm77]|nr:hypothetical protein NECID01_1779 [Nematocida sp. AWRm77]
MSNILRIKQRIKSYRVAVSLLKRKIKQLKKTIAKGEHEEESIEEGEIVEHINREKRKRQLVEREVPPVLPITDIEKKAKTSMPDVLRSFFTTINTADILAQQGFLSQLLPFLTNALKYVILHDVVLFARQLDRYETVYSTLFPDGFEKDSSEVAQAFISIYAYVRKECTKEDLKAQTIKLLGKSASLPVINEGEIFQTAFDAATAIKLYCKVLDWDWTYNDFIRDQLLEEIKYVGKPFPVYVLSLLYAEWNRTLVVHKSLEYVIQILDRIAGIGSGENITHSPYCIESQLASSLMLRQFRPGASLKWHRKRIEEGSPSEKETIDRAWKIVLF